MDERRTDAKPVEAWVCRKGRGQWAFWVRPCPVSENPLCVQRLCGSPLGGVRNPHREFPMDQQQVSERQKVAGTA